MQVKCSSDLQPQVKKKSPYWPAGSVPSQIQHFRVSLLGALPDIEEVWSLFKNLTVYWTNK